MLSAPLHVQQSSLGDMLAKCKAQETRSVFLSASAGIPYLEPRSVAKLWLRRSRCHGLCKKRILFSKLIGVSIPIAQ